MSVLMFLRENSCFWLLISWVIISFGLWFEYRKDYFGKNSFDITIIGTLLVLFLHRFLYVLIFSKDYLSNYWSWSPFAWVDGEKIFLGSKPWVIFAFWYGAFDLRIFLLCCILIIYIISKLQQVPFIRIINNIVKILFLYSPVFFIASYFQNLLIGTNTDIFFSIHYWGFNGSRHPIQLYLILLWAIIIFSRKYIVKKVKSLVNNYYLLMFSFFLVCSSLIIQHSSYNVSSFMLNWIRIISLLFLIFGVINLIFEQLNIQEKNPKTQSQMNRFSQFNINNLRKTQNRWTKKK